MTKLLDLLSYPRAFLATLFGLVHTFIMSFVILFIAGVIRNRRVIDFAIIWLWSMPLIWASGARIIVRGRERVTHTGKGFLILFNHSSLMDIPVLYAYFPHSFRYGAKIELFKIPFFGAAMKICGVLPIDRSNRNKVMRVYDEAIARVNNGEAFALAPEGTRQKEARLGRFKRGPFEFAVNAQMDVVPVALAGAYDVLPKNSMLMGAGKWRRTIIVQILPRVPTQGVPIERVEEVLEQTRNLMDPSYVQLNEELAGF